MNRRDHAVVALLVIALVALAGVLALPSAPPVEGGASPAPTVALPPPVTYREGVVGVPVSITPATARSRSERTLVGLIFSGLVRLGPENGLQPDLAASWTTDDTGRVWTFRIRDDATWQDGAPVTAEDVVYTVDVLKSPDAVGAVSSSWAEVDATAIDPKTVELTLKTPVAGFLAAATQPLLPAHLLADVPFADLATTEFARRPIGTGPYALTELDSTQAVLTPRALLAPSPTPEPLPSVDSLASPVPAATPTGPVPYLEQIRLRFYQDAAALAHGLEAGEVDAIAGLPPDLDAEVAATPGVERIRYPSTTLSAVLLDLRPAHKELRDPRVRKALLAALDRDGLVSGALHGDAVRADALVPPGSWAFDPASAPPVSFDPQRAASLLSAAGWKRSGGAWMAPGTKKPYQLELLTVPDAMNPRLGIVARFVRDAWTALGMQVTLVQLPTADLAERLRGGDYVAAVVDISMGLEPDLYPLLASSQVRASGSNLSGYQDTELDPLLEAARAVGTPEQRAAAWKALLAGLAERRPILPVVWSDEVVFARGLENVTPRLITAPGDRFWDVLAWRLAADR